MSGKARGGALNKVFELYGQAGASGLPSLIKSGRLPAQADAARLITADVERKLELKPHHRLLEIGCGVGDLLIPLSFKVAAAVGLDHETLATAGTVRFNDGQVDFRAGRFPATVPEEHFDRILAYSVIHCLPDFSAVKAFITKAAELLSPEGRFLVGDIPSTGRKTRFINSAAGKAFDIEWKRRVKEAPEVENNPFAAMQHGDCIASLTDQQLAEMVLTLRESGFDAYLLPQHGDLPFGHTREDLLIVRR